MTKLAPILKEISKNVRVGGYDGSRSHDGKLHETCALSRRSGRGPKSIIWTPAMAKHNSRDSSTGCYASLIILAVSTVPTMPGVRPRNHPAFLQWREALRALRTRLHFDAPIS